jgi:hypothetical protein
MVCRIAMIMACGASNSVGLGDPAIMMDIGGAAKLAVELRPIDEDWAKKLEAAISTARRYAGLPPSTT